MDGFVTAFRRGGNIIAAGSPPAGRGRNDAIASGPVPLRLVVQRVLARASRVRAERVIAREGGAR